MTGSLVGEVSGAIAELLPRGPPIVVGWDGRTSSAPFARIASATLALAGHRVVELGLLPTPAIQLNIPLLGAQCGLVLTASHNPPEFNGIKCIAADGLEVPRAFEEQIEERVARNTILAMPFDQVGSVSQDPQGGPRYVEAILRRTDAAAVRERAFTVVLDCGNGASVPTSPALLRQLGCRVITLNAQVDGTFPGHLSEPTETNLKDIVRAVPTFGADLGVAHDGDADRAVFVDGKGRYIPGERVLALMAREAVRRNRGGVVVTPVSSSQSVEDVVRPIGGEVVYTRVGSPTVTREMKARKAVFGGEENGGLVFPELQLARDGAMTAAAMLSYLARERVGLAEAIDSVPAYVLRKEKLVCPAEYLDRVFQELGPALERDAEKVVTIDGLKAYRQGGWVLVRRSGTEPLIRVFAEARDATTADQLNAYALELVRSTLERLQRPSN